ncbi:hypothetical protein PCASD_16356 [Puccinia coronata f. sp. avenae]|uniref:RNA-directed DNA polymerase n=1 Tax=Puccinia coronata f. sp. avenae TaxID=200324 RepID=A0A2N5UH54_9BASI|nr:hypothetical protein PCASD_16356 [Puccinia coronata f. sp. avenae]
MTTRSATNPEDLSYNADPESIIRAANAAKRQAAASASRAALRARVISGRRLQRLSRLPPLPKSPSTTPPSFTAPDPPKPEMANKINYPPMSGVSHHTPSGERLSQDVDLMRLIMEAQHRNIIQAQQDREATAERSLPKPFIPPDPPTGRVDLQKFRIADGPSYNGPFHAIEPFLKWLSAVQIFFATKAVTHDADKIRIVGGLIREINTLSFYSNGVEQFVLKTWQEFKTSLLDFALPTLWRTKLRHQIHKLTMGDSESFLNYSTRARTLQSLVNFDNHTFSDFDLAEFVVSGLPDELKAQANNFELLEKVPFVYGTFESKLQRFYDNLPKKAGGRSRSAVQLAPPAQSSGPRLTKEETIWRIHSFLDSEGRCHHCKKTCGSLPGACAGPMSRDYINIPTTFVAPTKPPNYKPPKAWSSSQPAGKPTQPPAGRSTSRPSAVAGVSETPLFPDLDTASVAAFAAIDEELRLARTEGYVKPPRIVILLHCGDSNLRGLVDTGSEINLISETAARKLPLDIQHSTCPTRITLALDNKATQPLVLDRFITATLTDPLSELKFPDVHLKIGPIVGEYDMILGTPFLSQFHLSVSVSSQSIICNESARSIFDYRCTHHNEPKRESTREQPEDGKLPMTLESQILKEFEDLFPVDIPAVSSEAEVLSQSKDATFPDKMQDAASKIRHRIVLTDPDAIINERQYPYPQKHLVAWRTLLDQHIEAGRIRRSTSQYASPSMIIPKKDPTALPRWVCDYRTLNKFTVKDRSPLPNVDELLRLVATGKIFSVLDQTNAFFQTRMREADIPLTAVKTPWGLHEWVVMPMGLTNAPATHQARLEEALGELINNICVVYLDDIVVFSDSITSHEQHIRRVLERLRRANLYCSPKKTQLFRTTVKFLGHWISPDGVRADDEKIAQVLDWPSPTSPKGVKKFLGTVQWMKKFIWGLQKYVGTLTPLTSSKLDKKDFKWGQAEEDAFNNIKRIMTSLPCLKNVDYESDDPLWLFTDASGSGLGAALFQGKDWKQASPIAYESHLMTPAERNYPVHEQELLAVVHALQKWRMLLLGMKIHVMTDHHSLTHLLKQRNLSRRQARWTELLADFDLEFDYIKGEDNTVADALSRKNIPSEDEAISPHSVACVAALTELGTMLSDSLKTKVMAGYTLDHFCTTLRRSLPLRDDCVDADGLMFIDGRLVIPNTGDLRLTLMTEAHERLGHLGYLKTISELRRDFFWPKMAKDVDSFVRSCLVCQRTKAPTTAPTGKMLTPEFPRIPLQDIAIDFVGPFKSTGHYDMLMSCTCRLSGFTRLIPTLQKDTAEKTASRFFTSWLALFGSPSSIISDRDKAWSSRFWQALMNRTSTRFHRSSAFHPQGDGRSERTNKTVGQILRALTTKRQGKWLELLPAVEYAINSAVNVATGISPLELLFGRPPTLFADTPAEDAPPALSKWLRIREAYWHDTRDRLCLSRIRQAHQHNKRNTAKDPVAEGSQVLLNSADWRATRQTGSDKLKDRFEGPYEVLRVFNHGQNVELDLPDGDLRHPAFHVSKIKPFVDRTGIAGSLTTKVSSSHECTPK